MMMQEGGDEVIRSIIQQGLSAAVDAAEHSG